MRITEVRVLPVHDNPKLKAYVTIVIDGSLVVRNLKLIKRTDNYFLAMPQKKMKDGTFEDLIHPLNKETRQVLETIVIDEYKRVLTNYAK